MQTEPLLAITLGVPAGIAPEIIVKALAQAELYGICRPLVIGSAEVVRHAIRAAELRIDVHAVAGPGQAHFQSGTIDVLDLDNVDVNRLSMGKVDIECGRAGVESDLRGARMAMDGEVDGIVNGPMSKEAAVLSHPRYLDHVAILEDVTGCSGCRPMLVGGKLQVVHVTAHLAVNDVQAHLSQGQVLETIVQTHAGLQALGVPGPRIGVSSLNPHGGDGGFWARRRLRRSVLPFEKPRAEG